MPGWVPYRGPRPSIYRVLGQYIRRPGQYNEAQNPINLSFKTFRQKRPFPGKLLKTVIIDFSVLFTKLGQKGARMSLKLA